MSDAKERRPGWNRALTVFGLMSRIPLRRPFSTDFSRADFWIPALSPLVAVASAAGFAVGMALTGSFLLAACSSLGLQYFCFNLFHLDGLLDTADALLPAATRERRFEILKDPRLGSYAYFVGLLVLAAKAGAMALLAEEGILFSVLAVGLFAAPVAGRAAAALVVLRGRPARAEGLGALMVGFTRRRVLLGALVGSLPALLVGGLSGPWYLSPLCAVAIVLGAVLPALLVGRAYDKALGGFTGDALGAAIELGELAALLFLGIALRLTGGLVL